MKCTITATAFAFGLACVSGVGVAQDQLPAANLQHINVTAAPGQYETYVVDLNTGFGLETLVGNTHKQYMQAQRHTEMSEALRKRGMAQSPLVTVAIDNSTGPGLARQVRLFDGAQNTLAIVNVYCHHAPRSEGRRCQLVSQPVSTSTNNRSLASIQVGSSSLALTQEDHSH